MPMLCRYQQSDGLIMGIWSAPSLELLQAQIVEDDPGYGYLVVSEQEAAALQEQWIVQGEALVAKPAVTITAQPNPFAADGTSECVVTVEPFTPCTLRAGSTDYALTAEDTSLILTADVPTQLLCTLPLQAACWARELVVEAT